jgi:hypothetical protein
MRKLWLSLAVLLIIVNISVLAQDEDTPAPDGAFSVLVNDSGRLIVKLADASSTEWMEIWIGTSDDFTELHRDWYEIAEDALCVADVCDVQIDAYPAVDNYVVYIHPWGPGGFAENNLNGWFGPEVLAVTEPPDTPRGDFRAGVDQYGQVVLTLDDARYTEWVQVWVGESDTLEQVHREWYGLDMNAECANGVCTLPLNIYPGYGDYTIYIQPWGEAGFAQNDMDGWFGPGETSNDTPPPQAPDNTAVVFQGTATLTWDASAHTLYYRVWMGAPDGEQYAFRWISAADAGCGAGGTCAMPVQGRIPYGSTVQWYIQAWGRGGYSIGGLEGGWQRGPDFLVGTTDFALGGQVHQFTQADKMHHAGMGWVKRQIVFSQGENKLAEAQYYINDAHSRGFRIVLGIVGNKGQLANDPEGFMTDYANFVAAVSLMMGTEGAIEIWNEPNLEREWPRNMVSGTLYTDLLQRSYTAIKNSNPSIMVISAAPAPTGVSIGGEVIPDDEFIRQMKAAGAENYMDCVGVHYNEGVLPPTATSGDPRGNDIHHSRYFPAMVELYSNTFTTKPLCFTEIGYLSPEGLGNLPYGFEWARDTSVGEQAAWITEAALMARDDRRIRMFIVWNVDFRNYDANDPMAGWAVVRPDGQCPACNALNAHFR